MKTKGNKLTFSKLVDVQGVATLLNNLGFKSTKQRAAVLSALHSCKGPMTAEKIVAKTGIDLATVYRTLESFDKVGLIDKFNLKNSSFFYEIKSEHHHHIVCNRCGYIEEVEVCNVDKVVPLTKKFSTITEHSLEFFGICKSCAKSS